MHVDSDLYINSIISFCLGLNGSQVLTDPIAQDLWTGNEVGGIKTLVDNTLAVDITVRYTFKLSAEFLSWTITLAHVLQGLGYGYAGFGLWIPVNSAQ